MSSRRPRPVEATPALKRAVLGASVRFGAAVVASPDGPVLPGAAGDVLVTWAQCEAALGPTKVTAPAAAARLARWFRLRRWVADTPLTMLAEHARVVGLPVGHLRHPGQPWVVERVTGGALDLGLGVKALDPHHPDEVVLVPPSLWPAAGIDTGPWWWPARSRLEEMGWLAVGRRVRRQDDALRPMGDADVLSLLGSRAFRADLAATSNGMATLVVPSRTAGWLMTSRVDPAFAPTAAVATDAPDRGFPRPVLVTPDEIVVVAAGGNPVTLALSDPLPPSWHGSRPEWTTPRTDDD